MPKLKLGIKSWYGKQLWWQWEISTILEEVKVTWLVLFSFGTSTAHGAVTHNILTGFCVLVYRLINSHLRATVLCEHTYINLIMNIIISCVYDLETSWMYFVTLVFAFILITINVALLITWIFSNGILSFKIFSKIPFVFLQLLFLGLDKM